MMAHLKWDLDPPSPHQLKKKKKTLSKLDPLRQNFLDPRMNYARRQFNFNRAGSDALHACADPEHFVRGGSERGPKCHEKWTTIGPSAKHNCR